MTAAVSGYFSIGKIRLGWVFGADTAGREALTRWPFASLAEDQRSVRVPFPGGEKEWGALQRHLSGCGIAFSSDQKLIGDKSVENARRRYDLSTAKKLDVSKDIPGLVRPLYPFQEAGVMYAETMGFRALIGDDMGLGKTQQGLGCALLSGSKRVVVVTRAVARGSWDRATRDWTSYTRWHATGQKTDDVQLPMLRPFRGKSGLHERLTPVGKRASEAMLEDGGVLILNYDILFHWKDEILACKPDIIIFDEAHAIKEPSSQRSQAAYVLMQEIDKVICLTGTPILNKPKEIYYIIHNLHPGKWGTFFQFGKRYCDAKEVVIGRKKPRYVNGKLIPGELKKAWDYNGSSRETELHYRMRATGMIRRLKDDVLDLPPKQESTFYLKPSKVYLQKEKDLEAEMEAFVLANPDADNPMATVLLEKLLQAAAEDKLDWVEEWLGNFVEDTDQKLVIFFHRQMVGKRLELILSKLNQRYVRLYGSNPEKNGDARFQEDPDCRFALCSYGVAREAVTLTAASYQFFVEYAWVPGWIEQAMDRTRRIGQSKPVNYYHAVLEGSVEETVVKSLSDKQDIISMIMEGYKRKNIKIGANAMDEEGKALPPKKSRKKKVEVANVTAELFEENLSPA